MHLVWLDLQVRERHLGLLAYLIFRGNIRATYGTYLTEYTKFTSTIL